MFEALRTIRRPERKSIESFLATLSRQPSLGGDFEATAEDGRTHQVKVIGRRMLSYWTDHAVREIRLTNLEIIE